MISRIIMFSKIIMINRKQNHNYLLQLRFSRAKEKCNTFCNKIHRYNKGLENKNKRNKREDKRKGGPKTTTSTDLTKPRWISSSTLFTPTLRLFSLPPPMWEAQRKCKIRMKYLATYGQDKTSKESTATVYQLLGCDTLLLIYFFLHSFFHYTDITSNPHSRETKKPTRKQERSSIKHPPRPIRIRGVKHSGLLRD